MPSSSLLTIEKLLAVAHQSLWRAAALAETERDQGLCDDLYQLCTEVGRINTDLLTSARPRRSSPSTVRISRIR